MNHADVQSWLDRYVEAWRTNERAPIEALFTEDIVYRFRPYSSEHEEVGIDAVVEDWLGGSRDEPDTWDAKYEPFAVDGDRAAATGYSHYLAGPLGPERMFHNVFLMRFGPDGRCAEFTEVYMQEELT